MVQTAGQKAPTAADERAAAQADINERDGAEGVSEDGGGEEASRVVVSGDGPGDGAAEAAVRRGDADFEDNGRDALAKQIASRRGKADNDNGGDNDNEPDAELAPAAGARPAPAATRTTEVARQPAAQPRRVNAADLDPDSIIVVKVNGREMEVTAGDFIANGQKYLAGDDYFRQGKQFLEDARRTPPSNDNRDRPNDGQNQPARRDTQPPGPARTTKTKVAAETLVPLADKMQTGTPEEFAAALADLLNQNADNGATNQSDVPALVRETLGAERAATGIRNEVNEALNSLGETHPELVKMDSLAPSLFKGGVDRMVQNLRAIGVPEEDLSLPPMEVVNGYGRLRQDPNWRDKLPSIKDVYHDTATAIETDIGLTPQRRTASEDRETDRAGQPVVRTTAQRELRRTTIPQQPRPAAIRAQPGVTEQARVRDPSATIARMAQQRDEGLTLRR